MKKKGNFVSSSNSKLVKTYDWILIIGLIFLLTGIVGTFIVPETLGFFFGFSFVIGVILFAIFHISMIVDMAKRGRWVMFAFAIIFSFFTFGLIGILFSLEHYFSKARKEWKQSTS